MWQIEGKTALVTGATSGLGKAIALGLAKQGAQVVIVARNAERALATRSEITSKTNQNNIGVLLADLASQKSIRNMVRAFNEQYSQLHILVNNAGNTFMQRAVSPDGIEMSLAVNHLAPFLLTNLLLDTLKACAPARIINVGTRLNASIDVDDPQFIRRPYQGLQAYAQSKLGNIHFTYELAKRLTGTGVTVNCVHPGVFRSNLGKTGGESPRWLKIVTGLGQPFLNSAEKASERVLYLASAPELEGVSGKYFGNKRELISPPQTRDNAARAQVWELSARLTNL